MAKPKATPGKASAGQGREAPEPGPPELSGRHRKTLDALFADPVRANIRWGDVVALLEALGATRKESGGSMVGFTLNGVRAVLHRPHPGDELSKPGIRSVREFLNNAGQSP